MYSIQYFGKKRKTTEESTVNNFYTSLGENQTNDLYDN